MTQLTLFLDGIPHADSKLTSLARLLGRADPLTVCPDTRLFAPLLHSLGLSTEPGADLPLAVLSRLASGREASGLWLYADPVHQQADQDKVYLLGRAELSPEENEEALRTLNQLFAEDGWQFHAHDAGRWLLHLPSGEPPFTIPVEQVQGVAIDPSMLQSRDNISWQRAMTEMQMLLHGCDFNHQREGQGLPTVNGIWLWGAGYLPQAAPFQWQTLWGEGEVLRGLAALHGIHANTVPKDYASWRAQAGEGSHWLLLSLAPDQGIGGKLERYWFAPLVQALRRGDLTSLHIKAANGRSWCITRHELWRWWRRSSTLSAILS